MMTIKPFGKTKNGELAELITLETPTARCAISTLGGTLVSLWVPDRDGVLRDVVLGYDRVEDYEAQGSYMGALIGRYANRIGGSRFTLNGRVYELPANEGTNILHGGQGFDKRVWQHREIPNGVALSLTSPDMDQGFPGTMQVRVCYRLEGAALSIEYQATCDRDTVCNLTNHAYFNLSGQGSGTAVDTVLMLNADRFTPVRDSSCIPTGALAEVTGTPMDFRTPTPIGARINEPTEQLSYGSGYDHNWVINGPMNVLRTAAEAVSPKTGIRMTVRTTLPGIQFYAANFVGGGPIGKGGAVYENRDAFCLETQLFPDSPNQSAFPSAVLSAGGVWHHTTVYDFSC